MTTFIYLMLVFNPANEFVAFQGFFKAEDCEYQVAQRKRQRPKYLVYCQRVDVR
jgi:hypothetical protein